jgi:hypothetical protein
MGKAHKNRKKPDQPKSETNALAILENINTINCKQTPPIQSSAQTHLDVWHLAMWDSLQLQH